MAIVESWLPSQHRVCDSYLICTYGVHQRNDVVTYDNAHVILNNYYFSICNT